MDEEYVIKKLSKIKSKLEKLCEPELIINKDIFPFTFTAIDNVMGSIQKHLYENIDIEYKRYYKYNTYIFDNNCDFIFNSNAFNPALGSSKYKCEATEVYILTDNDIKHVTCKCEELDPSSIKLQIQTYNPYKPYDTEVLDYKYLDTSFNTKTYMRNKSHLPISKQLLPYMIDFVSAYAYRINKRIVQDLYIKDYSDDTKLFNIDYDNAKYKIDHLHNKNLLMKIYYPIKFDKSIKTVSDNKSLYVLVLIEKLGGYTFRLISPLDDGDIDILYNREFSIDEIIQIEENPITKLLPRFANEFILKNK